MIRKGNTNRDIKTSLLPTTPGAYIIGRNSTPATTITPKNIAEFVLKKTTQIPRHIQIRQQNTGKEVLSKIIQR